MRVLTIIVAVVALIAAPVAAQVTLPLPQLPRIGQPVQSTLGTLERTRAQLERTIDQLASDRLRTIERLVQRNSAIIEFDGSGEPARRGELLIMDASRGALAPALAADFAILADEQIEGLDITVTRLAVPAGMSLAQAEAALAALLPDLEVTADNLHFQAGAAPAAVAAPPAPSAQGQARASAPVGMIDGAPGRSVPVAEMRGFAQGAPYASNHGSSIASLLFHAGASTVRVADVYGTDAAGGNALAIARALGWLTERGSAVVTISLVGPRNPVLERAIAAAQRRGVVIVAAVGNAGPAAPPAYPASYAGVIAVTAVDGRRRALIEAGRALHLDYAAPGADLHGRNARGGRTRLRGTSFATPLVAARAARAIGQGRNWRRALDDEAIDLGTPGPDETFGRGLVCASCTGI